MIEEPLDRLNYYNGQRLEASDLKLEQEYHIRVRRWLNKSLYTAGIASGLDVRGESGTRFVVVGPGLALDADGREILLLEEERIFVPAFSAATGSTANPQGLYLTIRYDEEPIQNESGQCVPQSRNGKKGNHAAWGGPALLRAKPLFNWSDALPYDSSGEVVLAQVALDSSCTYAIVNPGVRRYVGAASAAKVYQFALEGERDIDQNNSGKIYFHVRGRQPNAVTLYLRAALFSTLYYSELGDHTHGLGVSGTLSGPVDSAASPKLSTDKESGDPNTAGAPTPHEHTQFPATHVFNSHATDSAIMLTDVSGGGPSGVLPLLLAPPVAAVSFVPGTIFAQSDLIPHLSTTAAYNNPDFQAKITGATPHIHQHDHTHTFIFDSGNSSLGFAGASDQPARTGVKALTYVTDLQVAIDNRPVTQDIINQLKGTDSTWSKLGDSAHSLKDGTGEIKLDFLPGVSFLEGEHLIEFSVSGDGNGGRILYNLYVE